MAKSQLAITILATILVISLALNAYQWGGSLTLTQQEEKQEMASLLLHTQSAINAKLQKIDAILLADCHDLSTTGLTGTQADKVLSELYTNSSGLVVNAATSDKKDVLVAVQPSNYSDIIGEDIKNQEQNIYMHDTMRPALSNLIPLVEGFPGVVIVAPIFDSNEQFMGALSIVIQPYQLIQPIAQTSLTDTSYSMWAMQTNGTLIYDPDPAQQGKNLFTDPIYVDYPGVQTFAHQVAAVQSGYGTYQYYDSNLDNTAKVVVNKEAYWTTIGIYNTEWRLVITHITNQ